MHLQSNLNSSIADGSFSKANSNSFLSPYEILQSSRKQIVREIFLFYHEILWFVYSLETPHRDGRLYIVAYCVEDRKDFPKLSQFASWPGAMINPQWLELPISRTNFHGPKDVRVIEARLYIVAFKLYYYFCLLSYVGSKSITLFSVVTFPTYNIMWA